MDIKKFKPLHINATAEDLAGNNDIGRYIFLPGSDGRAKEIATHFKNVTVKSHSRGHHLYLGTLISEGRTIDVAAVSSGMGCPSMEIILHELFHLGAKHFLRVGTAGSLQPKLVSIGTVVNATASVRDECTTTDYAPLEIPAIGSFEFTSAILHAAKKLQLLDKVQTGLVHCKSSFYAREFGAGPRHAENVAYLELLSRYGVLASEMETAALFIQSQFYNHQLRQKGQGPRFRVIAGALLGILATPPDHMATESETLATTKNMVELALEAMKTLAVMETWRKRVILGF